MARPTKYIEGIHGPWAKSLAMEGLIEKEIAARMGIAMSTLSKWKKEIDGFSEAIKIGKEPADANAKISLYKRVTGYMVTEKKIIVELDANGNQKPAKIETIEKHIPPDVGAIAFWLKNRLPEDWRDKHDVSLSGDPFTELMKAAGGKEDNAGE
jgi:transcriptional regulator with XRE-family HTH domain